MSSRNRYLSVDERRRAPAMRKGLLEAFEAMKAGERRAGAIRAAVSARMEEGGFETEYVELVDGATLQPVEEAAGRVLLAAAGRLGSTRLIDNIALDAGPGGVAETLLEFPEWSRYVG
jgi:pantoate--beta-alanine ligase